MRRLWLCLVLAPLAGCAGAPGDASFVGGVQESATEANVAGEDCTSATVFFLVEYAQAQLHLPPGFQPRDLSGFLYHTPVTSGKVPAFAAVTQCAHFEVRDGAQVTRGRLQVFYMGFYVEAPWVDYPNATAPVDHDFYAVAFQGPGEDVDALLPQTGWDWARAAPAVDVDVHASQRVGAAPGGGGPFGLAAPDRVEVSEGKGSVTRSETDYVFTARGIYPQAFPAPPKLRFWHDGDSGLGYLQFDLEERTTIAGPADCWIDPDSRLAEVVGRSSEAGVDVCGPVDSFSLVFPPHDLAGTLRHMPGVRAG